MSSGPTWTSSRCTAPRRFRQAPTASTPTPSQASRETGSIDPAEDRRSVIRALASILLPLAGAFFLSSSSVALQLAGPGTPRGLELAATKQVRLGEIALHSQRGQPHPEEGVQIRRGGDRTAIAKRRGIAVVESDLRKAVPPHAITVTHPPIAVARHAIVVPHAVTVTRHTVAEGTGVAAVAVPRKAVAPPVSR